MKKHSFKYLFSIVSLLSLGSFLTIFSNATLSWFNTKDVIGFNDEAFGKGLANYFESGDGSEESPYIISNSTHFYNFSWLQYLGQFNKDEDGDGNIDQKYFKLKNDINMNGFILPPVGTEEYPFVGNFNGQNYIINNLTVSNSYDDLKTSRHPSTVNASNYTQMNIVGTFGIIGQYNTTLSYTSSINSVSNFYLENVSILTDSSNLLVGIFAGYANGVISNCGVHSSNVKVKSGTSYIADSTLSKYSGSNVSKYTLLGAYNSTDYKREDQEGDGDTGYGTSTDIRNLYERINVVAPDMISSDVMTLPKTYAIPFDFDSSSSVVEGSGKTTISSSGNSINASNASTISVASTGTNIGYYSGGEVKVYEDYFNSTKVDFNNMKTAGNSQISVNDDVEHINKIKTYLNTTVSSDSSYRNGDTAMVLSGTYFSDGSSSSGTAFPSSNDHYLVVQNAKVGDWSGNLFIPARGIWVAPVTPGRFEFVAINTKNEGFLTNASISIVRLKRSTPKDYSTGFSNTTYIQGTNFENDMCGCTIYGGSNAYVPYYFGVDVTQDDIDNGYEFFITKYASDILANPYIVYIDIGSNGGTDPDTRTALTNIDYVTTDSSDSIIKMDDSSYTKSYVSFTISSGLDNTYTYYFKRNSDGVYYYVINNGYNYISSNGTGTSVKSKDENCDEQA